MAASALSLPFAGPDDDDHLTPRDFERIARLIGDKVGIKLPPAKRIMVEGRLRKRVRSLGLVDFADYTAHLFERDGLDEELVHLINAVTTNKTDFFREPEHFEVMVNKLVPALLAERRGERKPLLKIWSAASSTGAEAYTIAMVMNDLEAQRRDLSYAILGTDIDTNVLEQAARAVFPAEMADAVPADQSARYIMQPRKPGLRAEVRIAPELRKRVQFAHLNLMDKSYPFDRDVDLIFLRNVLIYFEKSDQEAVINRLVGHLRPRGYLLLGHSESMIGTSITMRQVAPAVFQKV
ncbi:CheR family methyltransferase [Devosia sp.]|uniref:CheR family methyltransferase n=1 Tax=Devosia sp. TaxID=1871048 RepID=UPI0037C0B96E